MAMHQKTKKMKDLREMKYLIVEDQPESRAIMRGMLSELGATQVFESPNGRAAFQFIDAAIDMIDIIICDWNMPEMTGMDLLRQLRSVYPDMPFLMVTGRNDFESVSEAKVGGVTGYISKPYSVTQLEAKLRIVVHRMQK